jgi:hypothetical protein
MSNLTLLEVKEAKKVLRSEVSGAITKFIDQTGIIPTLEVKVITFDTLMSDKPVVGSVEVNVNASI